MNAAQSGSGSSHAAVPAGLVAIQPGNEPGLGCDPQLEQVIGALMAEMSEGPPRLENLALSPPDLGYRSAPSTPMTYAMVGSLEQLCSITRAHRTYVPPDARPVIGVLSAGLALNCTAGGLQISGHPADPEAHDRLGATTSRDPGAVDGQGPGSDGASARAAPEHPTTSDRVD